MYRGIISFNCSECGTKFRAPDVEWHATCYSAPQLCPQCGSCRTYPASFCSLFDELNKWRYDKIWEKMERGQ